MTYRVENQVLTGDEYKARIAGIRERVVGMYTQIPWPGTRQTDEEMSWRLKALGVSPEDYTDRNVIEIGCGTGDYALWYAGHGARHVTGVDLSDGSLIKAREKAEHHSINNVSFLKQDVLSLELPDNAFDYSFSVGVLHHTGDPFRGFLEMVRVTKPGGVVIVSLYNNYSRFLLNLRQRICRWLGGDDISARVRWGQCLFPFSIRKLNKRYHGLNYREILYDTYGFPHETLHTANEVLRWFKQTGVRYTGSFAPLRVQDYPYILSLPEYDQFRNTFDGFPFMRFVGDIFASGTAKKVRRREREFLEPERLNAILCQLLWMPFGLRISCFTVAGRKQ
ncbi:MAG: class I SAM-dependent methyltransferase [Candidatus Binatia bacterium]